MASVTQTAPIPAASLWTGRILSGLAAALLLLGGIMDVLKLPQAVEGAVQAGYPAGVVFPLGVVVLVCVALYAIPRTSVLGAILLTGYLGGATATHVRLGQAQFIAPVVFGVFVWGGLWLRDTRLRTLLPVRR